MAPTFALARLRAFLGLSRRPSLWKLFFVLYALLNWKNVPLAWHVSPQPLNSWRLAFSSICTLRQMARHPSIGKLTFSQVRVFWGFLSQLYRTRGPVPPNVTPAALFQPLIIRTRPTWYECDWNMHKSNSTYFSDFDAARCHLVTWVGGRGLTNLRKELGSSVNVHLGGVQCNFRKEIKPYEGFEIWTRVLAWDLKWLYVISHFMKKGSVEPREWTLQPWRKLKHKGQKGTAVNGSANRDAEAAPAQPHPAIYASAIAKYVFKQGRLTVMPSRVLEASGLLPPKPAGEPEDSSSHSAVPNERSSEPDGIDSEAPKTPVGRDKSLEENTVASLTAPQTDVDGWDWQRVEDERTRGMKLAALFSGLDGLNAEFRGGDDKALGVYFDMI